MAKQKIWCRAEIVIIQQCSGNMRVKHIATLIGRTESAVRTKARELGICLYLRGKFHQSVKYHRAALFVKVAAAFTATSGIIDFNLLGLGMVP